MNDLRADYFRVEENREKATKDNDSGGEEKFFHTKKLKIE
jgi:hypothetical protein